MVDIQTIAIIILVVVIDIFAFFEYYKYKIKLDEARKRVSVQAQTVSAQPSQSVQSPAERIKQSIQTPLVVVNNGSSQSQSQVKALNSDVEKLKNDNTVLQKKSDLASSKAKNTIQTSLNEVGGKIDDVLLQVQNVKGKMNSTQPS